MKLATIMKITAAIALTLAVLPALSLADSITATGTVTDVNGHPVAGADVTLLDDSYRALGATKTDANGNFQLVNASTFGSSLIKAFVTYVHDGQNYSTRLENVLWIDVSSGLVSIPLNETRLYDYPRSDHGYVWGTVIEAPANGVGRYTDATVYLDGGSVHRSVKTGENGVPGAFQIEVPPGEYRIYAVHDADGYRLVSDRTTITVQPSNNILDSAPINLVADHRPTVPLGDVKAVPFALALVIGAGIIVAGRALLNKK